jgi:hypothetical protein
MPHDGPAFVDASLPLLASRATLHVALFAAESAIDLAVDELVTRLAVVGWHARPLGRVKTGNHKPRVFRWTVDLALERRP